MSPVRYGLSPMFSVFPEKKVSSCTPYSPQTSPHDTTFGNAQLKLGYADSAENNPRFLLVGEDSTILSLQIRWHQAEVVMDRLYNVHITDDVIRSFHYADLLTALGFIPARFIFCHHK